MDLYKIAGIALISLSLIVTLKNIKREDFALFVTLIASILLIVFILAKLEAVIELLNSFANNASIDKNYFYLLLKALGISYIVEIVANICKDSGASSLATKVEITGKLSIVIITIPLITTLLSTITNIL